MKKRDTLLDQFRAARRQFAEMGREPGTGLDAYYLDAALQHVQETQERLASMARKGDAPRASDWAAFNNARAEIRLVKVAAKANPSMLDVLRAHSAMARLASLGIEGKIARAQRSPRLESAQREKHLEALKEKLERLERNWEEGQHAAVSRFLPGEEELQGRKAASLQSRRSPRTAGFITGLEIMQRQERLAASLQRDSKVALKKLKAHGRIARRKA